MNSERYCQVAIDRSGGKILTYGIDRSPVHDKLEGCRVKVPLGSRSTVGIVVGYTDQPPPCRIRKIGDVLDSLPSVPREILELTNWVADYYLCSWAEALKAALPAGLLRSPALSIRWAGSEFEGEWPSEVLDDPSLRHLARVIAGLGHATRGVITRKDKRPRLFIRLRRLEEHGLIRITEGSTADPLKTLTVEMVQLLPDADPGRIPDRATARKRLYEALASSGGEEAWNRLRIKVRVTRSVLMSLIKDGIVTTRNVSKYKSISGFDPRSSTSQTGLSDEQSAAVDAVTGAAETGKYTAFLLTGPPGCGKTKVYIELAREEVARGRGVLLLVPEISLTPQVVSRLQADIDTPVAVLHSSLTSAQRAATWREVRQGRISVVVGPRSAVYAPVNDLGLIIVDEEHEESFKQMDPTPRYHARDVAMVRAKKASARILLVSATPSLESLRLVETEDASRLNLTHRFGAGWPQIRVVDRRRERRNAPFVGPELAREIKACKKKDEGIVLLITRRGYSPVLVCRDCGIRVMCRHCELALTLHHGTDGDRLKCHLCGYSTIVPTECGECGSKNLVTAGAGTQRIEDEIGRRFPFLAPVRMDHDSTRKKGAYEEILRHFSEGDAQLLVGTQMVAKGHDFGHVTLVGVVNADTSLFLPDFRASERTFRLLVQAAGRAGRGERSGKVIIQTLDPDNALFGALEEPDVYGFLKRELELRRSFSYPPYARMAMVTLASDKDAKASQAAEAVAGKFRNIHGPVITIGPAQAQVARVKRKYRYRIILRTKREDDPSGQILRSTIRQVRERFGIPGGVRWITDIDPVVVT